MMKKKWMSLLLAGCLCVSAPLACAEIPAHALSIIAYVKEVTVDKDVIAIGESVQLKLEWSTGAQQQIYYTSDDESVATVDANGVVTGLSDGVAVITISHSNIGTDKTITITVSSDVTESIHYNSSELTLGAKLHKYDTIHYDKKNIGGYAYVINTKGGYDSAYISEEDYVLPFDAELVGIDGSSFYLAPDLEELTYLDGRTLNVGDTIDKTTHLLCYDYVINQRVLPVFLPSYYEKYIGEGDIRVKAIDHEKKTITLEAVEETIDLEDYIKDYDSLSKAPYIVFSGNQALVTFDLMVQVDGCEVNPDTMEWSVGGTADTTYVSGSLSNVITAEYPDFSCRAYCLITAATPGTVHIKGTEIDTRYKKSLADVYWNLNVGEDGNFDGTVTYDEPAEEILPGDVNGDGKVSVTDMVMLQKWLLAVPGAELGDWKAADLCDDGVIDVFDLSLLKRALLEEQKSEVIPELMIIDYQIIGIGIDANLSVKLIDSQGMQYEQSFDKNEYYDNKDGAYWYGKADEIIRNGQQTAFMQSSEDVTAMTAFVQSAAQYQESEMVNWDLSITDYGVERLFALCPDENGNIQPIEICRFGGECAWLDNAEVQEFLTMFIMNGYYADRSMLDIFLMHAETEQ